MKTSIPIFLHFSDLIEITVHTQKNADAVSEHIIRQLNSMVEQIVSGNRLKDQFVVNIEYRGIPNNLVSLSKSGKHEYFFIKLSAHFEDWMKRFHRERLPDEDMDCLRKGDLDLLGECTKEKFRLFLSSIKK